MANNPLRFIDPNGLDIWEINSRGEIEWKEKSDDHRLYSLDKEGNRSSDNYITVGDRSILDNLSGKFKNGEVVYTTADKKGKNDIFNVFKFAADNSNIEWAVHKSKNDYTLGTKHLSENAGSWSDYGLEKAPSLSVHSHPGNNIDMGAEERSMGYVRTGTNTARMWEPSDWFNVRNDVNTNGKQTRYDYVYFPNSTRLYHVNYNGPAYIRTIGSNYKRFFFGTF